MNEIERSRILCPACRKERLTFPLGSDPEYGCPKCLARYPVDQGVIDLLPDSLSRRTIAQALMEWRPLIRVYESCLWRRSPIVTALTRLSFEHEYSLIRSGAQLERGEQVLDLACGPGLYVRRFARDLGVGTGYGLDLSLPMLRYAVERARAEGLKNLILIRGNAKELPFEAGEFHVVNCCGALHLFPDVAGVLREVHRVLKPGGRFTVVAFRRGESGLAQWRAALRLCLYGIDSFTTNNLRLQLQQAGFSEPRCLHAAGIFLIMSARKPEGEKCESA